MYILKKEANQILEGFKEGRQVRLREVSPENRYEYEFGNCYPGVEDAVFVLHGDHEEDYETYGEGGKDPRDMEAIEIHRSNDFSGGDEINGESGTVHFTHRYQFELVQVEYFDFFKNTEFGNVDPAKLFSPGTIARWDAEAAESERLAEQAREECRRKAEAYRQAQAVRDARGEHPDQVLINGEAFFVNKCKVGDTSTVAVALFNPHHQISRGYAPGRFKTGQVLNVVQPLSNAPTPEEQFQAEVTGFSGSRNTMYAKRIGREQCAASASAQPAHIAVGQA